MQLARAALVTFTLLLGCNSGGDSSPTAGDPKPSASTPSKSGFDMTKLEAQSAAAMKVAMAKPAVSIAMTGAWEEIALDPAVSSAGESLMTAIGEHPKFTPVAAEMMAKLQTSPTFTKLVTDFMASGALTDPAGVEAAFGNYVDAQLARPAFSEALDASIGRAMNTPEIEAALARFVGVIFEDSGVGLQVGLLFANTLTSDEAVAKLNAKVGTTPSDPDYEQKVFAYLTDEARLERFLVGFAELFGKHQAPRTAVIELLRSPAVLDVTATKVAEMMSVPEFYPLAEAALVAALDSNSDRALIESKLDPLLNHPQVITAMAGWLTGIADVPEVQQGCSTAFQQLFADPAFKELLMATFVE